ncbi:hypothetical protein EBR96_08330 [bacterium]|nr:hypothetical protein [bacterium]
MTIAGVEPDAVRLMTIHSAKGLEFDYVALMGCGNKMIRSEPEALLLGADGKIGIRLPRLSEAADLREDVRASRKSASVEEEKRVFYVGCTRAKDRLLISGVHNPDAKPSPVPQSYLDFVLAYATLQPTQITLEFPIPARHSPTTRLVFPKLQPNKTDFTHPEKPIATPRPVSPLLVPPIPEFNAGPAPYIEVSVGDVVRWLSCRRQYELGPVLAAFSQSDYENRDYYLQIGQLVHAGLELLLTTHSIHPTSDWFTGIATLHGMTTVSEPAYDHIRVCWETGLINELRNFSELRPEYPFRFNAGRLLISGRIDLLARENGRWVITDFKTDHVPDPVVSTAYRNQLYVYAASLFATEPELSEIDIQVLFTATGTRVRETLDRTMAEAMINRIELLPQQAFIPPEESVCKACGAYLVLGCKAR